ncbi:hypothetical protein FXB41_29850 [Bradyrhizobium canariense]|uniref:hypothetical protein n=1 Tax=Bradyrhizobium canariense TaxID=255045 RepID=UPI001CA552F6|nr:hypothetical protein [Bradyrhizobium canariense]MBW5438813.1 hypothetical protein [Bradyrhizobium canariense]
MKSLSYIYLFIIGTCTITQLLMGADLFVLVVLALISVGGALGLRKEPVIADWLYLMLVAYCGTLALILKTALFQTVDSNLSEPTTSCGYLLIGFTSLTAGYLASRPSAKTIGMAGLSSLFSRVDFLQLTTKLVFAVGLLLQGLHIILRPQFVPGTNVIEEGFGGFGAFYFLLPFSIAMQTALCIYQPSKRSNGITLVGMLLLIAAESVLGNVKKNIVDAALIVACSYFLFDNAKVNIKAVIAGIAAFMLLVLYINPLIHIMRPSLYGLSFEQRIDLGVKTLEDTGMDPWELADRSARVLRGYEAQYSPTGSYFYPSTLNFDRFALILPLDQITRALPRAGTMGSQIFSTIISTVLPSFLVPKEAAATPDLIAWHFGFRTIGSVSRPVVGLIPSAVAGFGVFGAAIIPFFTIFVGFRFLNLLTGSLKNNPWAISVFSSSTLLAEKEVAPFIEFFLRDFALSLVFALALKFAYSAHAQLGPKALAQMRPRRNERLES